VVEDQVTTEITEVIDTLKEMVDSKDLQEVDLNNTVDRVNTTNKVVDHKDLQVVDRANTINKALQVVDLQVVDLQAVAKVVNKVEITSMEKVIQDQAEVVTKTNKEANIQLKSHLDQTMVAKDKVNQVEEVDNNTKVDNQCHKVRIQNH
jgi:hypothetical protein